jgi:mRNA-degrading endonuclease RelE of RelBE toxin-antitoxin system
MKATLPEPEIVTRKGKPVSVIIVGGYRVVYEIADEIRIVRANRVRHRREIYR